MYAGNLDLWDFSRYLPQKNVRKKKVTLLV